MNRRTPQNPWRMLRLALAAAAILWMAPCTAQAAVASQGLQDALAAAAPGEEIPVIITLADRVDLTAFRQADAGLRRSRLVQALQARSAATQGPLLALLRRGGATAVTPLWVVNAVAAHATPDVVRDALALPGVAQVTLDLTLKAPRSNKGGSSAPEWNLSDIHAPDLWKLGFTGTGIVVANMDTGVDVNHPDLGGRWRGGTDSWFDPFANTAMPYDAIGHGTQTMGIMVGGDAGGSAIGVAPGASWIAAKIFDDSGNTSLSVIHQAFQWLLVPSGDVNAPDAPEVVEASWGLDNVNGCDNTFQSDFDALRIAGTVVVFSAGNSGPAPLTSVSPANNLDGYSVGAVDSSNAIASFSSRGPSACTNAVFPSTVAPGVNVKSADLSLAGSAQYAYVSGTSFSAPHVAGAAALLLGALPAATVSDVESSLESTATDLGTAGADDSYGYGLVNVLAAYNLLASGGNQPPVANNDSASTPKNTAVRIDVLANDSDPDGDGIDPATVAITAPPGNGSAVVNSDGTVTYTPNHNFGRTDTFDYTVADVLGATSNVARVTVTVTH